MPDNLLGEDKSIISKTHQGYVKQISKKIEKSNSYLEIGPDIGLVTRSVISQFEPNKVVLIEPNISFIEKKAIYTAVSRAQKRCIVVSTEFDFIKLQNENKKIDYKVSLFMEKSDKYEFPQ